VLDAFAFKNASNDGCDHCVSLVLHAEKITILTLCENNAFKHTALKNKNKAKDKK
jgi:hypothetical protein